MDLYFLYPRYIDPCRATKKRAEFPFGTDYDIHPEASKPPVFEFDGYKCVFISSLRTHQKSDRP